MNVALRSSLFHARHPYSTSHRVHHRLTLVTKPADRIYLVTLHCCEYRNRLGAERKHEHINGPYIYRMIYVPARHWKGAAMTHEDGTTPLNHLVKVLRLGDPSEYRGHTYISGESLYFPTGRVYGGQVIAQSLIAASKTVSPSRLPHSVHGYFIAAGDIRQDLLFDVETLRDGRSFSARRVNVTQASRNRGSPEWSSPIRCRRTCRHPKRSPVPRS